MLVDGNFVNQEQKNKERPQTSAIHKPKSAPFLNNVDKEDLYKILLAALQELGFPIETEKLTHHTNISINKSQSSSSEVPETSFNVAQFSATELDQLLQYLLFILKKNESINLTSIRDPKNATILHLIDSLLIIQTNTYRENLLRASQKQRRVRLLDIGTGGGFPGIPLAITTDIEATLIDSIGKKIAVVNEGINHLKIQHVRALHGRAEELLKEEYASFDLVVARAVGQMSELLEYSRPFLKKRGSVILSKALLTNDEYEQALLSAKVLGFGNVSRETFELPNDLGHREIISFEAVESSRVKLPRKVGLARKKPLYLLRLLSNK